MSTTTAVPALFDKRIRLIVSVVAVLHGVVTSSPADIWGWAELDDDIRPTLSIGTRADKILAFAWISAAILLVVGAVLRARCRPAWRWRVSPVSSPPKRSSSSGGRPPAPARSPTSSSWASWSSTGGWA
jgi:hypothetical protein